MTGKNRFIAKTLLTFAQVEYASFVDKQLYVLVDVSNSLFTLIIDMDDYSCVVNSESLDEFLARRFDIDKDMVKRICFTIMHVIYNADALMENHKKVEQSANI